MTPEQPAPVSVPCTITRDEFNTYWYAFEYQGKRLECFDFPTRDEAFQGARWHLFLLVNNLPHEECDGLGAIYRP